MTVGTILAYSMLLDQISKPMGNIPGRIASIREYSISIKDYRRFLIRKRRCLEKAFLRLKVRASWNLSM